MLVRRLSDEPNFRMTKRQFFLHFLSLVVAAVDVVVAAAVNFVAVNVAAVVIVAVKGDGDDAAFVCQGQHPEFLS